MIDDPFGPSPGKMTDLSGAELKNEFSTISSQNIDNMLQSQRIQPRQIGTGTMRGTQAVGSGGVKIDSAHNRITVGNIVLDGNTNTITTENTDGSKVGIGLIPGTANEFGFFATDADGTLVMKIVNGTLYTYNVNTGVNVVQLGRLPDSTYGLAAANEGFSVEEGF